MLAGFRLAESKPIVDAFYAWCDAEVARALDETPTATALGYARNQRVALQRFLQDGRLPIHNNGSERDIRMAKLKQKVSGCLRTTAGARQFCAIRSYLSTAAKNGLSFFDALVMLTKGGPWMPAAG